MPLDLHRLRTLSQVGERRSFSQAALDLNYTQSAVSQQIAGLERELGVRLVHRHPVALTDAGVAVCRRYEAALAELASAHAELESYRGGARGRMRIGAPPEVMAPLLPHASGPFSTAVPEAGTEFHPLGPAGSLAALRRGETDIAVSYDYDTGERSHARLRRVPLLRDRLTLAVPSGHRLAGRSGVRLAELAGERWIHSPDAEIPLELFERALGGGSFRPYLVVNGHGLHVGQALVAAGVGVALVPELEHLPDTGVRYLPLLAGDVGRSVYAAALDSHPTTGLVSAMFAALTLAGSRVGEAIRRGRAMRDECAAA